MLRTPEGENYEALLRALPAGVYIVGGRKVKI